MRTPSESSISLRFSSRVPKRGSRLGVISRAIFKGIGSLQGSGLGLRLTGYGPGGCGRRGDNAVKNLDRAVGRGFIPGKKRVKATWALAPEGCSFRLWNENSPVSATCELESDFEGSWRALGMSEPELWAVWRNRGLAWATKSGICA